VAATHHSDLLRTVKDWNAGKAVRSIELGHNQREIDAGINEQKRIDSTCHHRNRQDLAHAWTFRILARALEAQNPDMVYSDFAELCRELRETEMPNDANRLTSEELNGAESLAWKAWLLGWDRAIRGHEEHRYIQVSKE